MTFPILADAGVPMIFVHMPYMVMALVPIIIVEAAVACMRVSLSLGRLVAGVSLANVVSTLFGLPLTWIVMVVFEFLTAGGGAHGFDSPWAVFNTVVLQSAWLIPYKTALHWMVPAATLVLLVPYFLASVFIERLVLLRMWKAAPRSRVTSAVWLANAASYAGLAAIAAWRLVRELT